MENVKEVVDRLVLWLNCWYLNNGGYFNKAVIGMSGGKDSAVTAALCAKALGSDNVIGVLMPNGKDREEEQQNIKDAIKTCMLLGINFSIIDIKDLIDRELEKLEQAGIKVTEQAKINLPPRIRMATLYAVSQSFDARVINTCNLSEDWVGYSTKYGDAAGDVAPFANFTVDEVRQIGLELGLPYELVYKTPSDGLCGKSDEDNLGFTYEVLDKYIRTGYCKNKELQKKIDDRHVKNKFKLEPMQSYQYGEINAKVK